MYFWLLLVSSESTVMSANPDQSHFNLHIQRGTRRNDALRSYPKRCLQEFYVELVQLQSLNQLLVLPSPTLFLAETSGSQKIHQCLRAREQVAIVDRLKL